MPHSFSNCPLRSCSLLITQHTSQSIITATDDVLDSLGYSLADLKGHSIHTLHIKLSSNLTTNIPECTLQHANGNALVFQVCVHQNPLGFNSLDYWLLRLHTDHVETNQMHTITVLRLSPYGTIEQAKPYQHQWIGRPIMAFVYQDDVQPLCAHLSQLYHRPVVDPLLIRWSATTEESHGWMALALTSTRINSALYPVCLMRPLQIPFDEETSAYPCWVTKAQVYWTEFYQYIIDNWIDMVCYVKYILKEHTSMLQLGIK
ncbi:uncharacterized protein B0P05DRAFT_555760 [Gilbertella persicaria]|uniref:PAS domain-containing protein n=1 Tax=Rhizopus stolonifer TaxID=4846 RepID=A0A367KX71_RHIST|nr:uncharacterized protein B0P05DRAFT_555760 [Gilbertella persicaria]KAI8063404.1 hypothetical protein B0P05DRAFT_555760 [Gilbertella persicaria]RCI06472.1 hypothetical protein CU098_007463 [Rhizopus stolonifer]